jgi:hypothetical protein
MVDSMMIGRNLANIDPQSNFTGPNTLAELKETNMSDYPVTAATEALRRAESRSRKLRRAQIALEAAIKDLNAANYDTAALEAEHATIVERRNVARVQRELTRDVLKEAAVKAIEEAGDAYLHNTI